MKSFNLEFHPSSTQPVEPGDYVLYNQCDGYHIAEAHFDDLEFSGFYSFACANRFSEDFYCAWAKLPDTFADLYEHFARK